MREDLVWVLQRIKRCNTRNENPTRSNIFQGAYDVCPTPEYPQIMRNTLNEAKALGLIINDTGKEDWGWNDNWLITDLGETYLENKNV